MKNYIRTIQLLAGFCLFLLPSKVLAQCMASFIAPPIELRDPVCLDDGPFTNLTGNVSPAGGTYSGPGVTDNGDGTFNYNPFLAGVGTPDITYTIDGDCSASLSVVVDPACDCNCMPTGTCNYDCYGNNESNRIVFEICPSLPGQFAEAEILSGSYGQVTDNLTVYQGAMGSGTMGTLLFGPFNGSLPNTVIKATVAGECLIFVSNSDAGLSCADGFEAPLRVCGRSTSGISISDPCICFNNATTLTDGQFGETIKITSTPGLTWILTANTGLYMDGSAGPPAPPIPPVGAPVLIPTGTTFTEDPPASGMYFLNGMHIDAVGYSIEATSNTGEVQMIGNQCAYPNPVITTNLDGPFCPSSPPVTLTGIPGDANNVSAEFFVDGAGPVTEFDPGLLAPGPHTVTYTVDGGVPKAGGPNDPGCIQSVELPVFVAVDPGATMACNDMVLINLPKSGSVVVLPDMVLEGDDSPCYDVMITLNGVPIGSPSSDTVRCFHIGKTLVAKVTNPFNGNSCWAQLKVEDKTSPVCVGTKLTRICTEVIPGTTSTADVPLQVSATDNCTNPPLISLVSETIDGALNCATITPNVVITRTWVAQDAWGNVSPTCTSVININRVPVAFPLDIIWSCQQYKDRASIIDAENPVPTDFIPGTPLVVDVNPAMNVAAMANLGLFSGYPSGVAGLYCKREAAFSDLKLNTCDESGNTFKIVRTWTVLDWCDLSVAHHDQVIKVVDMTPPAIVQSNYTMEVTEAGEHPHPCRAIGTLLAAEVTDCSAVTVRYFTPIGEAINRVIPAPGLPEGDNNILITATDACGNANVHNVTVTVVDRTAPVAVCDEITAVNIASDGMAVVTAATFDDGTWDNCCLDKFLVNRMDDTNLNDGGPTGHLDFTDTVKFSCPDVGKTVIVAFRAFDCKGNTNDCMVQVEVKDKVPPTVTCPIDKAMVCDTFAVFFEAQLALLGNDQDAKSKLLDARFGAPTFSDNCTPILTRTFSTNLDQCLSGAITRTFSVTDQSGNGPVSCSQTIQVTHVSDFVVVFPNDVTYNCGATAPNFGGPVILKETCELVGIAFTDQVFTVVPDACYKIARRWSVMNWCVPGAIVTHEQTIKVIDTVEPSFGGGVDADGRPIPVNCDIPDVCIVSDACTATFELPQPVVTDCSPDVTKTATGQLGEGFGPFTAGPGTYTVQYRAIDNCNNQAICNTSITVRDCKKPTPYCRTGIVVTLMNSVPPMIEVWASDLDDNSFDNCPGNLKFSFSQDTTNKSITFVCSDLPPFSRLVRIWVTDAAGNQDFCQTLITVQDNQLFCPQPLINMAGRIGDEANQGIENVAVQLNGSAVNMFMTGVDGAYNFGAMPMGGDYSIVPEKDVDPLNGVSTFDLVLITKHILGSGPLDSPYKIIAADANKSNSVSTFDLVEIRKLILFIHTNFPNNTSWRFVDKGFVFPDPANPFQTQFPEIVNLNNLSTNELAIDFVAVKVGDVNGSAVGNLLGAQQDRATVGDLVLDVDDLDVKQGETYTVGFKATDFNASGYQFTLGFDRRTLDFVEVAPGLADAGNFGLAMVDKGVLTTSWNANEAKQLTPGDLVFSLVFKAKQSGRLSDLLDLNSQYTVAEAYNHNADLLNVALSFNNSAAGGGFDLYQNVPNPFTNKTTIGFYLPAAAPATLTISDVQGKVVKTITGDYAKGYNQIDLRRAELGANGILYYRLETGTDSATRKMVFVD